MTDGAGVNGLMLAGSSSPLRGETHKVGLIAGETIEEKMNASTVGEGNENR